MQTSATRFAAPPPALHDWADDLDLFTLEASDSDPAEPDSDAAYVEAWLRGEHD